MKHFILLISIFAFNLHSVEASKKANSLKVHEWGTFTSVQGSDGIPVAGLHHEEEALPSFIHNLDFSLEALRPINNSSEGLRCPVGCNYCCKGICCDNFTRSGRQVFVTQKMETPVLYFYHDEARAMEVDVTVDFPEGLISQYFPAPTSVQPLSSNITALERGQIHYSKIQVLSKGTKASVPPVSHGSVYAPARETAANHVRMAGETEKFIFYRGLGNFATSLRVTSTREAVTLTDGFGRGIPYLLALNIQNGKGAFKELGPISHGKSRVISATEFSKSLAPTMPLEAFESTVGQFLVKALVNSGLYFDEAQSMVNTWKLSYFRTEGMRILYILPRGETDAVLPIQISPQPSELVRTLVGRVEILLKSEEDQLLALFTEAALKNDTSSLKTLGRFSEPKLRRLQLLTSDTKVLDFINANLN